MPRKTLNHFLSEGSRETFGNISYVFNPTARELLGLLKKSKWKEIRFITDGKDLYAWDAGNVIHCEFSKTVLGKEGFTGCQDIDIGFANYRRDVGSISVGKNILKNPRLKRVFDSFIAMFAKNQKWSYSTEIVWTFTDDTSIDLSEANKTTTLNENKVPRRGLDFEVNGTVYWTNPGLNTIQAQLERGNTVKFVSDGDVNYYMWINDKKQHNVAAADIREWLFQNGYMSDNDKIASTMGHQSRWAQVAPVNKPTGLSFIGKHFMNNGIRVLWEERLNLVLEKKSGNLYHYRRSDNVFSFDGHKVLKNPSIQSVRNLVRSTRGFSNPLSLMTDGKKNVYVWYAPPTVSFNRVSDGVLNSGIGALEKNTGSLSTTWGSADWNSFVGKNLLQLKWTRKLLDYLGIRYKSVNKWDVLGPKRKNIIKRSDMDGFTFNIQAGRLFEEFDEIPLSSVKDGSTFVYKNPKSRDLKEIIDYAEDVASATNSWRKVDKSKFPIRFIVDGKDNLFVWSGWDGMHSELYPKIKKSSLNFSGKGVVFGQMEVNSHGKIQRVQYMAQKPSTAYTPSQPEHFEIVATAFANSVKKSRLTIDTKEWQYSVNDWLWNNKESRPKYTDHKFFR